jgi:cysteine-rich repeat protein
MQCHLIDFESDPWADKNLDSGEQWDDGNYFPGDGCDGNCQIEATYMCVYQGAGLGSVWAVWGNSKREGLEEWDDGDSTSGDGWSSTCIVETGFQWIGGTITTVDTWSEICGDSIRVGTEECDDGGVGPGFGCDGSWNVEIGYQWLGGSSTTIDTCSEICGDGIRFNSLVTYCDDGNNIDGDGWSSSCGIENGFVCAGGTSTTPDTCSVIWGDGIVAGIETCDDGNVISGDGWSFDCSVETGFEWSQGSSGSSICNKIIPKGNSSLSEKAALTIIISCIGAFISTIASSLSLLSPTGLWQSMNIMQLFLLIALLKIYIPDKILDILKAWKYFSLSYESPLNQDTPFISSTLSYLDFSHPNEKYEIVGVDSGSSLMNVLCLATTLLSIWVLHACSFPLKFWRKRNKLDDKNSTWQLICLKIWQTFTFGIYIRFALQSFQLLAVNSISGFYFSKMRDYPHLISILTSLIIGIFWVLIFCFGICMFLKRKKNWATELFTALKKNQASRFYQMTLMLRKAILIVWMVWFEFNLKLIYLLVPSLCQLAHLGYIIIVKPFSSIRDNVVEIFNEIIFTLILSGLVHLNEEESWSDIFVEIYFYLIISPGVFIILISLGKSPIYFT